MNTPPNIGATVRTRFSGISTGTVEAIAYDPRCLVFIRWPQGGGMWVHLDEIECGS